MCETIRSKVKTMMQINWKGKNSRHVNEIIQQTELMGDDELLEWYNEWIVDKCDNCKWGGRGFSIRDNIFCSPACGNKFFKLKKSDDDYWHDV